MRHGHTAGLLGIIVKVCLCIHICVVTDDLDGVLVRSNRTVCSQSPELTVDGSFRSRNQSRSCSKRKIGHIIFDTDGESCLVSVVKYCDDLCRRRILGTKSVTSAVDRNCIELRTLKR